MFVDSLVLEVVPVTIEHVRIARQACRDYGRGSGHPANLDVGDCFSDAFAAERQEPLLFVGEDVVHTDIRSALVNRATRLSARADDGGRTGSPRSG